MLLSIPLLTLQAKRKGTCLSLRGPTPAVAVPRHAKEERSLFFLLLPIVYKEGGLLLFLLNHCPPKHAQTHSFLLLLLLT